MFPLQEYDYGKLRTYWENYSKFIHELESKKSPNPYRVERMKLITESIEFLFNDASEDMQTIIQLNWWEGKNLSEVSAVLHMPVSKVRRMQRALLADTAERISWV
ncbi:hypothetical protein PGH26_13660 [Sporosarcina jeotgali]|uniref:RNA polymerase sigma-70 region 4 domain-containing protein n=1 Tax=Sporosarcina jeotgali TaxID=3020056 RepID=A0ABZ0KUR8_9BACL|nr:hypothetical protein [Sporosarcina sp. B2O-1]WOV83911.1 hypothetical protein PGH26_13660 [Sporosarcina sp. B2O-1]